MQVIRPFNDFILGTVIKTGPKSDSGLYIPESSQRRSAQSRVVSVGPLVQNVKPGMVILYKDYTHHETKLDGEEYVLVAEEDVLAAVEEVEPPK